ncbi:hypothetical protein ACFSKM_20940 [Ancylobacter dichloromethanicus]
MGTRGQITISRRTVLAALAASVPLMSASATRAQSDLATPVLPGSPDARPVTVTVAGRGIRVDGQPFAVRGVAGDGPLALLPGLGATTVRSYGEDPGPLLDEAGLLGLKVIAGLWVGQPRQGADYADAAFRARQLAELEAVVTRYREHPALLMWGIGNEVEVELADDTPVWPVIEEVAAMVARVDPAHPSLAVLAETGTDKVEKLRRAAPSVTVLGLNSYGDALYTVAERSRKQGWDGPIIVTELGALGQWQAARTPWGAPFEPELEPEGDPAAALSHGSGGGAGRRHSLPLGPEAGGDADLAQSAAAGRRLAGGGGGDGGGLGRAGAGRQPGATHRHAARRHRPQRPLRLLGGGTGRLVHARRGRTGQRPDGGALAGDGRKHGPRRWWRPRSGA